MFCKKCGAQMDENVKFCPKCGTPVNGEVATESKVIEEDNSIKFQLKPEFNWGYKILTTGVGTILIVLFLYLYFFLDVDDEEVFTYMFSPTLLLIAIGIAIICAAVKLAFQFIQYKNLSYNFYRTKVEYIDGFLNREEKELKYKFIREVTMTQSIFERMFKIGTVRIFTNASSGYYQNTNNHNSMVGKNGIIVHCVKNVREQYQKIKDIVDEGTPESND